MRRPEQRAPGTMVSTERGFVIITMRELIACHAKAVEALSVRISGQTGWLPMWELGSPSLGRVAVNYEEGIQCMPKEKVREQYITPWILAFPKAKLLDAQAVPAAKQYGMGCANDMAGMQGTPKSGLAAMDPEGGNYAQAEEEDVIGWAMPDFWKTAPSGVS